MLMAIIIQKLTRLPSLSKFAAAIKVNHSETRKASSDQKQTTCLYEFHKRKGARMEMFAGYLMPIVYKNQTITSEHLQTRDKASVFDVSHMMQTIIRGKDRIKFIESLTVTDVESMTLNKCALSVFTNDAGGIIDDCIIGKCENHLQIVSNAGNSEIVWSWLNSKLTKSMDVELERLVGRGLVALQGPKAAKVLQTLISEDLSEIGFMNTLDADVKGIGLCQVTRCGYTGEDGFEISVDPTKAESLMDTLCSNFDQDVLPAGLGARDTLRLEAGLCLHGHDITDQTTPVEAALNWTINKRRRSEGGFLGHQVILDQLKSGSKNKRIGLKSVGGGPPAREHCKVFDEDGQTCLGEVTSGTLAPKLQQNIAMAYLPRAFASKFDQSVYCNIRGKNYEYKITKMPFVKSNYYVKAE